MVKTKKIDKLNHKYHIYNSTNERLIEIDNIVDYNYSQNFKCDIKSIVILLDKYILKNDKLQLILQKVVTKLSKKNILNENINKICKDIEIDIINNKITESILTLELFCSDKINNNKGVYKIIFMNVKNILEDTYIQHKNSKLLTHKLLKNSFEYFEYCRELGSNIYKSMKKNNIYQCNIVNNCSSKVYNYLDKNNVFIKMKFTNPLYYKNIELLLFEGFCLSKYELNELKTHSYKETKETSRFGNNVLKLMGGGNKKSITKLNKLNNSASPSKNNYYLNFISMNNNPKLIQKINNELTNLLIKCKSIYLARDIINIPSNHKNSTNIITTIKHFISRNKLNIKVTVFEPDELLKKGMNLMYSVGQGSKKYKQSRLLILEYYGHKSNNKNTKSFNKNNKSDKFKNLKKSTTSDTSDISNTSDNNILLVGKGVTMDTGGIDLKPGKYIPEMKSDLAGACSVISSICACARMKINKNIVGLIPLAENAIGRKSTISGDVIKAYNGLNVEIINTDAEGRLLMADALSYGVEKYPKYKIIELSTLTGEVESFSCSRFSMGIGINWEQHELQKLVNQCEMNGERLVLLPFVSGFDDELKSDIADIRNVARDCKGQLYPSTTFLSYFINDDTKYLHIDIGGTAYKDNKKYKYEQYEGSGVGIKLLIDYLT